MSTTASTSDIIAKKFLYKEIGLLKVGGISLTGNESKAYKIYSLVILCLSITYPFVQLIGALIYVDEVDSDTIYCLFGIFLVIAKMTVILRRRTEIKETLRKLSRKPFTVNLMRGGKAEARLLKECIWITTAQATIYFTSLACGLFGTAAYTMMKRISSSNYQNWKLPFGKVLVFNTNISPAFEMVWLYQMISVFYISCCVTAIDLITAFVLCYVCYQFKFLQNALLRMVHNSCNEELKKPSWSSEEEGDQIDASTIKWKYLKKSLREIVGYHLEIIAIASEMERVFSLLFLLIIFYTTIILCFMIYRLSTIPINNPDVIPNVIEIIIYCLQVAILCFWGEQVSYESQVVADAAYKTNLVGTDVRFQRGLVLIIQRSQSPIKITAAKLTDIRLPTFVGIMRAAYSSFMLLRNIKGNESL